MNAPGGLLGRDNHTKPAYDALHGLIRGKWETHVDAVTDADGWVTLKGFKGEYAATSSQGAGKLRLDGAGDRELQLKEAMP